MLLKIRERERESQAADAIIMVHNLKANRSLSAIVATAEQSARTEQLIKGAKIEDGTKFMSGQ